jgi:DNA-binding response OmpR family regulator
VRQPFALIIEDNLDIAEFLAVAAREAGYEVKIVRSGQAALNQLLGIAPDLVILDLRLPYVHGTEILNWIRTNERLAATRVIVVTAFWEETSQVEEQADLVLLKPLEFVQLRELAARLQPRAV